MIDVIVADEEVQNVKVTDEVLKGLSAYEIAVKNGYKGTEEEWLKSLELDFEIPLPIEKGGTGALEPKEAQYNILNNINDLTNTEVVDTDNIVFSYEDGSAKDGKVFFRKITILWTYIKNKISSVLGMTADNYKGTSAKATADADGNNIKESYANRKNWLANVKTNTWSRICEIRNFNSFLLCLYFSQNSQSSIYTYVISTGHNKADISQIGFNGYENNDKIDIRIVLSTSEANTFYVEVLNPYGYNNAAEMSVQCTMTALSKAMLSEFTQLYTEYTASAECTVLKTLTSNSKGIVALNLYASNKVYEAGVMLSRKYASINHSHTSVLFDGSVEIQASGLVPVITLDGFYYASDYEFIIVTCSIPWSNYQFGADFSFIVDWQYLFADEIDTSNNIAGSFSYYSTDNDCTITTNIYLHATSDNTIKAFAETVAQYDDHNENNIFSDSVVMIKKIVAYT